MKRIGLAPNLGLKVAVAALAGCLLLGHPARASNTDCTVPTFAVLHADLIGPDARLYWEQT